MISGGDKIFLARAAAAAGEGEEEEKEEKGKQVFVALSVGLLA